MINRISLLVIVGFLVLIAAGPLPTATQNGGTGTITTPTSGQVLIGQSPTLYTPRTLSGCATVTSGGVVSVTCVNGDSNVAFTDVASQPLTGGFHPTAFSNGTVASGTKTIDCGNGPIQSLTNGGAFIFAMSANDGSCVVRITNNSSAGAITFSGFSEGTNVGDTITTTNTSKFDVAITRIGGNPHYLASALQ